MIRTQQSIACRVRFSSWFCVRFSSCSTWWAGVKTGSRLRLIGGAVGAVSHAHQLEPYKARPLAVACLAVAVVLRLGTLGRGALGGNTNLSAPAQATEANASPSTFE